MKSYQVSPRFRGLQVTHHSGWGPMKITEGSMSKGGQNPDWDGQHRPPPPQGSGGDLQQGIWFRSACSGLWYQERGAAGSVDVVMVDGVVYDRRVRRRKKYNL